MQDLLDDLNSKKVAEFVDRTREIIRQPGLVANVSGGIYVPNQEEFVRWCLSSAPAPVAEVGAPDPSRSEAQVVRQEMLPPSSPGLATTPPAPLTLPPEPQPQTPPAWLGQVVTPILDRIEAIEQRLLTPPPAPAYVPPAVPGYMQRLQQAPLSSFVTAFLPRTPGIR